MDGTITLKVHLRAGGDPGYVGQGDIVEQGTAVAEADGVSLDALMGAGGQAASELVGQGDGFAVHVNAMQGEHGGSFGGVELVIELVWIRDDLRALGWNVLAGLLLEEILRAARRDDDDR